MNRFLLAVGLATLLAPGLGNAECNPDPLSRNSPDSRFTDHQDGTVTDNQTGLMWKRCGEGKVWNGINKTCDGNVGIYMTWREALDRAQAVNGGAGEPLGHHDWRVPNVKELMSIVERGCGNPALNPTMFPNSYGSYWSSSPVVGDPGRAGYAWGIDFQYGFTVWQPKDNIYYFGARLVRGG